MRHPETGKLLVNFDPKILEVVRETKCMIKMKLDVPEQAKRLLKLESKLKGDKLYLQVRWILFSSYFERGFFVFCIFSFKEKDTFAVVLTQHWGEVCYYVDSFNFFSFIEG